jgi:cytochrome c oxidase subunit 3
MTTIVDTVPSAGNQEHAPRVDHGHEPPYAVQLRANRIGLWLFCFSELFLFGALLIALFYLWKDADGNVSRPDLDQTLGLITTSVLLISSYFMVQAETAISKGDRPRFLRNLLLTAFMGLLFLVGVVGFEWSGHVKPTSGMYGAIFFGMTGMHAIHVVSGLIFIIIVWNNGRRGHYSAERHWAVEACAIYWHYVDVIWVFFYPAIYLIGKAVHV